MYKTILKMHSKEGTDYAFTYAGHQRYSPNKTSISGYGSDDWFYLCTCEETTYILHFEVSGAYGYGCWVGRALTSQEARGLPLSKTKKWMNLLYKNGYDATIRLNLDNIEEVKHLLPTDARIGVLNNTHYRGF